MRKFAPYNRGCRKILRPLMNILIKYYNTAMKIKFTLLLLVAMLVISVSSCKKDDSPEVIPTPSKDIRFSGTTKTYEKVNDEWKLKKEGTKATYSLDINNEAKTLSLHIYDIKFDESMPIELAEIVVPDIPFTKSNDRLYNFKAETVVPLYQGKPFDRAVMTNIDGMFANTSNVTAGTSGETYALTVSFNCWGMKVEAATTYKK